MQSDTATYSLDIAQLIDLAKNDPEAFESERKAALDNFFESIHEENSVRLQSMQWRIDRERERSNNPMAVCVKLNSMMWGAFSGEGGFVSVLNNPIKSMADQQEKLAPVVSITR